MKNIMATVPKSRFKTFELAEQVLRQCDGENRFWTLRVPRLPKQDLIGSLCYMIYNDQVRGYFDIVDLDLAANWKRHDDQPQEGYVLILANWHPVSGLPEMPGFQGWRYTTLRP